MAVSIFMAVFGVPAKLKAYHTKKLGMDESLISLPDPFYNSSAGTPNMAGSIFMAVFGVPAKLI